MKLTVDLTALHKVVSKLNYKSDFSIDRQAIPLDPISVELAQGKMLGEDMQLSDISSDNGVLNYKGHQVMLYIADHWSEEKIANTLLDGTNGNRVHVAECETLTKMRESGRFQRYVAISRMDGLFPIWAKGRSSSKTKNENAKLYVCKNCLKILNYKGYTDLKRVEQNQIFKLFSFYEFFEKYSSYFKCLPATTNKNSGGYPKNWSSISKNIREERNFICEHCGVNLKQKPSLLHVHHISGNKADCSSKNLRVLCLDCHKKQPHHGHMYVSNNDVLFINRVRREQNKFDVFDYNQSMECADTALEELLKKCKTMRIPAWELGIKVNDIDIDLCWPRSKVAVLISKTHINELQQLGWNVFSAFDALTYFEQFQSYVR